MGCLAAFVLIVGVALAARAHGGHDWIREGGFKDGDGNPCCDPRDCRMIPVASGDVEELENGDFRYLPTGEVIPRADTRPSPDQNFWRCWWYVNGREVTRQRCFWRPVPPS
jgi:hypothetical protein